MYFLHKRGEDLSLSTWTIVAIIIAVLVVASIVAFTALYVMRRRRSPKEDLPIISSRHQVDRKRKTMTPEERQQAEETERSFMIRKSLASRSTLHSIASRDTHMLDTARSSRVVDDDDEHPEVPELPTIVGDWKEWEAQAQAGRTNSRPGELSAGGETHPALVQELEDLQIPAQIRTSSPSRDTKNAIQLSHLPSLSPPTSPSS
ncbi:uncharacterized protein JN550_013829 [Neoarthrinium moseri]|uniref:uncharacterized protein n=1 Tax=Neoarthrinium moseri TaxID=1658444 RepID=UPI001FDCFA9F|nr:uncharacterized protein JN550_013829 [Neoarthrinium moseri]KAI1856343.1 hypothetical protein JN550_013829 [Neoarthrinium moseri]